MTNEPHLRVGSPPPKPLLIWDGDCHFCRLWIERWQVITRGEVDYATYQEVADRFPAISPEQFQKSVVFVDKDGEVFFAAEAVYRSLRYRSSRKWLSWSYDRVPGLAAFSEIAYKIVARNRGFGSSITRLLWGNDVRPPTYFASRRWFLRALGVVYLIAFVSLWVQLDGLIGTRGVSPVGEFLPAAHQQLGGRAFWILPTLCWFNSSDAFLHLLCGGGVFLSLLLIVGIAPAVSLVGLFVFYLSLVAMSDPSFNPFFNFQWDILLLETGFLAIFLAPWRLWPKRGREPPVSRVALFLLKFLLFKLLLMSGVVKLTSGDDCWWNLTALDYHYWSQPLPTIFAWWADQHPEWFKHFSVAFCLVVEIIVPFFIWAPRRLRLLAAGLIIFLQIAIAITGNYCFFNLLTIALCLLLIDDSGWRRQRGALQADGGTRVVVSSQINSRITTYRLSILASVAVLIVTLPLNLWLIFSAFKPRAPWPGALAFAYRYVEPFRIVNGYGLFRVMTKERREIVIEGSADGVDWLPYEFKWKPGDVKRAPGWCAPHQPRLDWQMWFAALGSPQQNPWFLRLLEELLRGSPPVIGLIERNPFPDKPPRYMRAMFYDYGFTTAEEHRQTGAWWKRRELREYVPTVSLDQYR
jgi:predicted DCC family thiol-disulfide oxidoreductase YuxK